MPAQLGGATWSPGHTTALAVQSIVRGGRRDVVHSHLAKADFASFFAQPLTHARRYSTWHILGPRGYRAVSHVLARMVARDLATEFAVSQYVADRIAARRPVVLRNGVATTDTLVDTTHNHVVLVAQRLEVEKDLETGLRAWALSRLADRGWRLRVAGTGPELSQLTALAHELGVADSVTFLGWVADVPAQMALAAMLLAPPTAEPLGLTVLEAMARGLPVVASGSAGHLETLGQFDGAALFPPGDAVACAQVMNDLAADPQRRAGYGRDLQLLQQKKFSLSHHVDELEAQYGRDGT